MSLFNLDSKDIIHNPAPIAPVRVTIPDDAVANSNIFPSRVLSGYNGEPTKYTDKEWESYMLGLFREQPNATGVYWCSGMQPEDIQRNHISHLVIHLC